MFSTPKKRGRPRTKKGTACAPKVPFNKCESKRANCIWVHGKRQYCRTRKNKKRLN
jgi:hypothetical protein